MNNFLTLSILRNLFHIVCLSICFFTQNIYAFQILSSNDPNVLLQDSSKNIYKFNVQEAVEYGIKNASEMINSRLNIEIQKEFNKEILSYALPVVSANIANANFLELPKSFIPDFISPAMYGLLQEVKDANGNPLTLPPQPTGGGTYAAFQQPYTLNASLTLNQMIYQPEVFLALETRKAIIKYANEQHENNEKQLKESIIKTYYSILVAQQKVILLEETMERTSKLAYQIEKMYQSGLREKVDSDRIKLALSSLETTKKQSLNGLKAAELFFKNSLGLSITDSLVLTDSLSERMIQEGHISWDNFDVNNRLELKQLMTGQTLQQYDMKRYKLTFLPTINFSLTGGYNALRGNWNFFDTNKEWFPFAVANFTINVPLTNFTGAFKYKQAQLKYQQMLNQEKNLRDMLTIEAMTNMKNFNDQLENLQMKKRDLQLSEEVYSTIKTKYDEGMASSFELIDASNQVSQSQNQYLQALLDAMLTKIKLQKSFGNL